MDSNKLQKSQEVLIDPFTGERIFLPARAEKIEAELEAKALGHLIKEELPKGKPEGIWSADEFGSAMEMPAHFGFKVLAKLRDQFDKGKTNANFADLEIPHQALAQYINHQGRVATGIQQEWGEKAAAAYKAKRALSLAGLEDVPLGKPEDVWSSNDLGNAIGLTPSAGAFIIKDLKQKCADTGQDAPYLGLKIPIAAFVSFRHTTGRISHGLKREWGEMIVQAYKNKKESRKPEDIWSVEQLAEAMNLGVASVRYIVKQLHKQLTDDGHAEYLGCAFPAASLVNYYNEMGFKTQGMQAEWAEKLVSIYKEKKGMDRGVPDNVWPQVEAAELMGISSGVVSKQIALCQAAFDQGAEEGSFFGLVVPCDAIVRYTSKNGIPSYGIHDDWIEKIAAAYKAEKGEIRGQPEGIWSPEQLAAELKLTLGRAQKIIKDLRDQISAGKTFGDFYGLQVPKEGLATYTTQAGRTVYAIKEEWGKKIVQQYKDTKGEVRGLPEGAWSNEELANALGLTTDGAVTAIRYIRNQFKAGQAQAYYYGMSLPPEAVIQYTTHSGNAGYALDAIWGEKLAQAKNNRSIVHNKNEPDIGVHQQGMATQEANTTLDISKLHSTKITNSGHLQPKKSLARMTDEERAAAKRGFRGRGGAE